MAANEKSRHGRTPSGIRPCRLTRQQAFQLRWSALRQVIQQLRTNLCCHSTSRIGQGKGVHAFFAFRKFVPELLGPRNQGGALSRHRSQCSKPRPGFSRPKPLLTAHSPADVVVWLKIHEFSGIYREKGNRLWDNPLIAHLNAKAKHGAFVCRKEADAAGYRGSQSG